MEIVAVFVVGPHEILWIHGVQGSPANPLDSLGCKAKEKRSKVNLFSLVAGFVWGLLEVIAAWLWDIICLGPYARCVDIFLMCAFIRGHIVIKSVY